MGLGKELPMVAGMEARRESVAAGDARENQNMASLASSPAEWRKWK